MLFVIVFLKNRSDGAEMYTQRWQYTSTRARQPCKDIWYPETNQWMADLLKEFRSVSVLDRCLLLETSRYFGYANRLNGYTCWEVQSVKGK